MEGKKISFGFTKTRRAVDTRLAAPVQPRADDERREYIECVEEKAIKVVGGEVLEENKPLVIPLKPNTLATAERLQQIAAEVESSLQAEAELKDKSEESATEPPPPGNETLEQQAARELLQEARQGRGEEMLALTVPMPSLPPLLGEKESTLEDYESVPVGDFGMAMLRGMGWAPGKESKYTQPTLRPKGLGLGADKLVKPGGGKKKGDAREGEEELKIQTGSLVRVVAGKHSGVYGKVVSLDEESGRVLVEPAMKGPSVSLSEHTLQPVTRRHYDDNCRVINSDKYDEYKMKEKLANEKQENSGSSRKTQSSEDSRTRPKHESKNSHESRRYSSGSESMKSLSSEESKRTKKSKKNKERDGTPVGKRDIDKKRKGKKKKRDRDRSPNHRRHKR